MGLVTATKTFASFGPLAAEEIWQCREGSVLISLEAVASTDQGLELLKGDSLTIAAGKTVRLRTKSRGLVNREVTG